jgi:hypothetical protein
VMQEISMLWENSKAFTFIAAGIYAMGLIV